MKLKAISRILLSPNFLMYASGRSRLTILALVLTSILLPISFQSQANVFLLLQSYAAIRSPSIGKNSKLSSYPEVASDRVVLKSDGISNRSPSIGSNLKRPSFQESYGQGSKLAEERIRKHLNFSGRTALNFMHLHKTGGVSFKLVLYKFLAARQRRMEIAYISKSRVTS